MNTGLGDAENLAWKLALVAHRRAAPALLDSYETERRPVAAEVLQSTSALTRMVLGDGRLARMLRDHVFVPSLNHPAVQKLIWEQASQLRVNYRRGPLRGRGRRHFHLGARPGDRIPDLSCRRPDGSLTRLHSELGSTWVLLTPPAATPRAALATQRCVDLARRRLGADLVAVLTPTEPVRRNVLLVRPDAHLGWRGAPSPAALERWMLDVLGYGEVSRTSLRSGVGPHHPVVSAGAVDS
jgi:4,5-epoxidase